MRRKIDLNWNFSMTISKLRYLDLASALVDCRFAAFLELEQRKFVFASERGVEKHKIYSAEKRLAKERYEARLMVLSPAELEEAYEKMLAEIAQRSPGDERLFFNEPFADAEYHHWARQFSWSLEEFAALLLGKDPDIVNFHSLQHLSRSSTFVTNFVTLLHCLQQAKEQDELRECVRPEELLGWARAHQIEVPSELSQSLEAHSAETLAAGAGKVGDYNKPNDQPLTPTEKTAYAKERQSLLKMLGGIVLVTYGDQAFATRKLAREVASDLHKQGIAIDEDTVRKWLNEAKQIVDQTRS